MGPGHRRTLRDLVRGRRPQVWRPAPSPTTPSPAAAGRSAEIGSVHSYPSLSGDIAVWCSASARSTCPSINGVRDRAAASPRGRRRGRAPVVSGGLVVWATAGPVRSWPASERRGAARGGEPLARPAERHRPCRPHARLGPDLRGRGAAWWRPSDVDGGDTREARRRDHRSRGTRVRRQTVVWAGRRRRATG